MNPFPISLYPAGTAFLHKMEWFIGPRVGHDQVFSLYAPIPIFQKNKFSDPITDQIFEQNSDQIPIIDPIKITQSARKKTAFFANDNFLFLFVITSTI
jgi:hypothetical protein